MKLRRAGRDGTFRAHVGREDKVAMTPSRPAGSEAIGVLVWGTRCRGWERARWNSR